MIIYGIYFICCMTNYLEVVEEQLKMVVQSGLYNVTTQLLLFVTLYKHPNSELLSLIKKYDIHNKITMITTKENLYEKFAINNYKKYISNTDYYLYYFHTKGLSRTNAKQPHYIGRRKILNYYTLEQYKINIELLSKYDAVGCSLSLYPRMHFSGNFWWSKSSYLNTLHDVTSPNYLAVEMYILSNPACKYISLTQDTNVQNMTQFNNYKYKNEIEIIENLSTKPIVIPLAAGLPF